MTYQFGKAVSGGRPITTDEIRDLQVEQLQALRRQLARPEPTADPLDRRLAEELGYSERLLAMAEDELKRRGGPPAVVRALHEAATVVEDVAGVVEAKDRCEGVQRASPEVKRRLLRDGAAGNGICRR
ncbi:hypothetical protein [Sphingomonas sp.]|uniref:hypothetical protein n=1 Tax=Sphingomonas sp. TaxID=28214 RepID=UPI003CC62315